MINLDKEVICGYEVSAQMKRIWAMELDMVEKFVAVCQEHNMMYMIMGGTLLGAVRHKGFIPWDNDIDILMLRHDFNKLLEIGPEAFKNPLFFQTPVTEESRFFSTHIKIRNGNGTAATPEDYEKGINCGIFIDVFCLDEIPDSSWIRKMYFWRLNEIAKMWRFALGKELQKGLINSIKHSLQKFVYRFVYHSPDASALFDIYQKAAGKYAGKCCRQVAHQAFGYHENFIWDKKDWDDHILLDFEYLKLNAPEGYDVILRHQYGDYMELPEDKSTHDYIDFNPDVPYKEYFGRLFSVNPEKV
jgi:lipopolysaccharide cholinephosphotransferase